MAVPAKIIHHWDLSSLLLLLLLLVLVVVVVVVLRRWLYPNLGSLWASLVSNSISSKSSFHFLISYFQEDCEFKGEEVFFLHSYDVGAREFYAAGKMCVEEKRKKKAC